MEPVLFAVSLIIAYLLGSLPTGLTVVKAVRGVDIRRYGSGSTGSTNVYRTLGRTPAIAVIVLDIAKGSVAVAIAWFATGGGEYAQAIAGLGVIAGHSWPVFSRFKGGRGVMTGWGAMIALSPIAAGFTAIGWVIITVTRYVSVGSLIGTTVGGIALIVLGIVGLAPREYAIFGVLGAVMIFIRHFDNISRLASGTEEPVTEPGRPRRARTRHG